MALAASGPGSKGSLMVVAAPTPLGELDIVGAAGRTCEAVLSGLGSGYEGLSSDDAADRLREFGPNALATHRVRASAVLFRQIRNPILVMLLAAALVSALTGGGTNAVIIVVIVALSVGLGFFNEYRAEMAMEALRGQIRHEAEVLRDGRSCRVPVTNLVPGDVVSLRIGGLVPADLRLLTVEELECDEGVLTGESMPVAKSTEAVPATPPLISRDVCSWGRSSTRAPGWAWWSRPEPAPRSGGSRRACPRSRARPRSRWACRSSRVFCSRWRPG